MLERHLLEKYGEPCPAAMVESGLDHIKLLQDNDFHEFKISVKASDVFLAAAAYQALAEATDAVAQRPRRAAPQSSVGFITR